jgi:hypothetical protein
VDGGGGTEFFASQDESHEEDAGDQATAEEEEEQDSGALTVMSFLSYRPQTGRRTTRGASGASDTIQTTATSGGSINLLWETPRLPAI